MKVINFNGDWYKLRDIIPVDYQIDYNMYPSGDAIYIVNREAGNNCATYMTSIDIHDIERIIIAKSSLTIISKIGHIVLCNGSVISQFTSQAKHFIE